MKSTVYIVTSGEYSDYSIRAVFDDSECAEVFVKNYNKTNEWSSAQVEEFDLNPISLEDLISNKKTFRIEMTKCGDVSKTILISDIPKALCLTFNYYGGHTVLVGHVAAKTEKQAIKILNELRIQFIALFQNGWGDGEKLELLKKQT